MTRFRTRTSQSKSPNDSATTSTSSATATKLKSLRSSKRSSQKSSKRSTVAARRKLRSDGGGGRSTLTDLTRPISRDRHLLRGRIARWLVPIGSLGIFVAFAFVLLVRPVQTYFAQNRAIEERTMQYDQIVTVNGQLRTEVERLKTPEGIREAAREQVGYVGAGEERLTVNATGLVPTELPAGWPYNMATAIFATRSNPPATGTPATAPTSSPATTPAITQP